MAHHKAGGSTKNGRDSKGRRLGLKVCGGGRITKGAVIVRQRGTHYFLIWAKTIQSLRLLMALLYSKKPKIIGFLLVWRENNNIKCYFAVKSSSFLYHIVA